MHLVKWPPEMKNARPDSCWYPSLSSRHTKVLVAHDGRSVREFFIVAGASPDTGSARRAWKHGLRPASRSHDPELVQC
jgi:hypothetical protein